MEKNTVWAIALSTVVLVGFMMIQTYFFPAQKNQNVPAADQSVEAVAETEQVENASSGDVSEAVVNSAVPVLAASESEETAEQTFTITTNKVKVTFTNRGGDIISYELIDHKDTDTGKGVEMADNISAKNRAFGLSLGGADNPIINDLFTAKQIDERTIGFFKKFVVKGENGSQSEFTLVKTYSFKEDDYLFKLNITVDGAADFTGLNFNNAAYTLRTAPQIGPHFDRKVDRYENRTYVSYNGEKAKKIVLGTNQLKGYDKEWKWSALGGKYFVIVADPVESGIMANEVKYSSQTEVNDYANAQLFMTRLPITAGKTSDTWNIYIGPRAEKELVKYNYADKNEWGIENAHYNYSLQGSGILNIVEVVLKFIMEMLYKVIPNWGVSIILMTVILKLAMFPLTKKSSLGTMKMQQIQPKIQEIQAKYKDNPQKMQQETAKLYKEIGYNPMSGCLPLVFQFIILFAMYNLFNNYFEFRGASFIPGWIGDLSRGDEVAVLKFNIPFLGNHLRILPVIYVISQLLFGKITQNGGTASGTQMNMKMMMYGMPLIFFFLFYNAPSGLLLYWTVSNVFQLIQQLIINRTMKNAVITVPVKTGKKR